MSSNLKVLQVIPKLGYGGAETGCYDIAHYLPENGCKSFIVTSGGELLKFVDKNKVKVFRLPVQSKNPILILINAIILTFIILFNNISIIHARSRAPAWSCLIASKITSFDPTTKLETEEKKLLKQWEIEKDKKIILLPGRLTTWKGQEVFIEAINLVNIELGYEAFYAVILGSDQGRDLYKKKLIRLSEQYRLTKQLRFIDHCKDMALAYKVSDIIVSASIEPEAFGRVSVEAQSMEKPIIASNIGGSNETVVDEKTGYLFKAGDAKSLSQKILKTLTIDETQLKLIGIEGRKNIVQKFNVEKMCFSTYSEYKRLIN